MAKQAASPTKARARGIIFYIPSCHSQHSAAGAIRSCGRGTASHAYQEHTAAYQEHTAAYQPHLYNFTIRVIVVVRILGAVDTIHLVLIEVVTAIIYVSVAVANLAAYRTFMCHADQPLKGGAGSAGGASTASCTRKTQP